MKRTFEKKLKHRISLHLPGTFMAIATAFFLMACGGSGELEADLIITNGAIYTVNPEAPTAEAVVVKADTIVYVGSAEGAAVYKGEATQTIDLQGKTMIPGFIEGHAHIMGVGYNLQRVDLMGTTSWEQVISRVEEAVEKAEPGAWIMGRGWHQDKWDSLPEMVQGFPVHDQLSAVSPNNPCILKACQRSHGHYQPKGYGHGRHYQGKS